MTFAIVDEKAFEGPSLWLDRPVVRILLRSPAGAACPSGFQESLERLEAGIDRARSAPLALPMVPDSRSVAWWLGWGAVGLQRLAGDEVAFFSARTLDHAGSSEVVVECRHRQTGLLAVRLTLQQIIALTTIGHSRFDLETAFTRRLAMVAAARRPDSTRGCILDAARARGIPIVSIDPRGRVQELGTGIHRRRLFNATTSNTSSIGAWISGDKHLSLHYLRECGLPVPDTLVARDAGQAVEHAQTIGVPVVVKPIDAGDAAGVHVDLRTEAEVRAAFEDAAAISRSDTVVVQRYLIGKEYRFLVVDGKIVAMIQRVPAHVVGDGRHTVRELVELENGNPRRGTKKSDRLKSLEIGAKALGMLERQGLSLDDVPADGMRVQLNPTGHITAGGEAIEMTAAVHPENAGIVVAAARALEVDIAGIDLIAEDIGRSIWETSGGIVEVNCGPGFWIHQFPTAGVDIDPGPAVVETLFPPGSPVRVPLVAVTGARLTDEIARAIGRLLTRAGSVPGTACQAGLLLGETRLGGFEGAGVENKRRLLLHPLVEQAVLAVAPEEIVAEGLAFEQCDVAVVTGLSGASPAGLPEAESVVCRTVAPEGVIVAPNDDPGVLAMARATGRALAVYGKGDGPEWADRWVTQHALDGQFALAVGWDGAGVTWAIERRLPEEMLAAIAATLAIGIPLETVRRLVVSGAG